MLLQNIKTSFKRLIHNKLYTIINVGGLSLSFAVAILILLYVYNELNVDKYHKNLTSLYRLTDKQNNSSCSPAKFGEYIINKYPEVKYVSRYYEINNVTFQYGDHKSTKMDHIAFLDSSSLDMFSINIIKCKTKDLLRTNQSIIISESTAKKLFGTKDPLGQVFTYENKYDYIIEGVYKDYPSNSCFKHDVIANFPSVRIIWEGFPEYDVFNNEGDYAFTSFLMLKEDVNKKQFDSVIQKDLVKRFGRSSEYYLQEFSDIYFNNDISDDGIKHGNKQLVYIFLSIALIIVIIAMINYTNLSTSISAKRLSSIGVYKTLGAQRSNLIMQSMIETCLICIIALIFGYILAELFIPVFNHLLQYNLQVKVFYTYPFNIISLLSAIVIAFISGLYPAFYLTGVSPTQALKKEVTGNKGVGVFKKNLIVFQFVITISLISGTLLIYKQLRYWENSDFGINKEYILTIELKEPDTMAKVFQERIEKIPNVEKTCFSVGTVCDVRNGMYDNIDGQEISMSHLHVDADFFDLYGIQVIDGKGFSKTNPDANIRTYLLNESAVKYLNWESPYEKNIWGNKCIGVVKDFRFNSLHSTIQPLRISYLYTDATLNIKISPQNIPLTIKHIKEIWDEMSPAFPFEYRFVDDIINSHYKNEERLTKLLGYFAAFSIFIACLGLFGLISFMAEQRTKEIGVRKAHGAKIKNIISLFSKEFIQLILISGIIATPLSYYFLSKWLQNFAYPVKLSWWVFAVSIIIAIVVSSLSVFYRAYRAASQNPIDALRYE